MKIKFIYYCFLPKKELYSNKYLCIWFFLNRGLHAIFKNIDMMIENSAVDFKKTCTWQKTLTKFLCRPFLRVIAQPEHNSGGHCNRQNRVVRKKIIYKLKCYGPWKSETFYLFISLLFVEIIGASCPFSD